MAAKLNLTVEQHATFKKRLIWRDKNKRAINLTGYTAKLQVRSAIADAVPLLELSTANGSIVITSLTGTIDITITDEQTGALVFKTGLYDLILESAIGEKTRLVEGKFTVAPGVTHV